MKLLAIMYMYEILNHFDRLVYPCLNITSTVSQWIKSPAQKGRLFSYSCFLWQLQSKAYDETIEQIV